MVDLASESSREEPIALHKIAEKEHISTEFLQQIFFRLRKAGLIAAARGPGGGFYLAKDMHNVTALDVLQAAGECLRIAPCTEVKRGRHKPCSELQCCEAGEFWLGMENSIKQFAQRKTLAELVEPGQVDSIRANGAQPPEDGSAGASSAASKLLKPSLC
jgi:Rrf2 family iron-sulfur cluster assembly transcriptional regulator